MRATRGGSDVALTIFFLEKIGPINGLKGSVGLVGAFGPSSDLYRCAGSLGGDGCTSARHVLYAAHTCVIS